MWVLRQVAEHRCQIQRQELPRDHLVGVLADRCSAALDIGHVERAHSAASQALQLVQGGAGATLAELAAAEVAFEEEAWSIAESHLQRAMSSASAAISAQLARLRLAQRHLDAGNVERAEALSSELRAVQDLDEELAAGLRGLEGRLHHARGDFAAARASLEAAYEAFLGMGRRSAAAELSLDLGLVEIADGNAEGAARHLAAAQPLSHRPSIEKLRTRLADSL